MQRIRIWETTARCPACDGQQFDATAPADPHAPLVCGQCRAPISRAELLAGIGTRVAAGAAQRIRRGGGAARLRRCPVPVFCPSDVPEEKRAMTDSQSKALRIWGFAAECSACGNRHFSERIDAQAKAPDGALVCLACGGRTSAVEVLGRIAARMAENAAKRALYRQRRRELMEQRRQQILALSAAAARILARLEPRRSRFYDAEHLSASLERGAAALARFAPIAYTDPETGETRPLDAAELAGARFERGATRVVLADGRRLSGLKIREADYQRALRRLKPSDLV